MFCSVLVLLGKAVISGFLSGFSVMADYLVAQHLN
jgi:hypothetical protein